MLTAGYTDRLNALLTPAGWTRRYTVIPAQTLSGPRTKDRSQSARYLRTHDLWTWFTLSHRGGVADNDNAGTAAEAQAFNAPAPAWARPLSVLLHRNMGDLDERKRPKNIPRLLGWATPQGWREGLRPARKRKRVVQPKPARGERCNAEDANALVRQILEMAEPLGWRLYRGLLRTGQESGIRTRFGRECSAQGIGANAVSGTRPAAPGGCFE